MTVPDSYERMKLVAANIGDEPRPLPKMVGKYQTSVICMFKNQNATPGSPKTMKKMVFTTDHYFSRDLQSTIPGDYYFNGL